MSGSRGRDHNTTSTEIRLEIYRYLFLIDCGWAFLLEPKSAYNKREKDPDERSEEESLVKEYGALLDHLIMHPAILRTNRKIYFEAATILYSKTEMIVNASDVLCISKDPGPSSILRVTQKLWRHVPVQGVQFQKDTGTTAYTLPEGDGDMEPHVFARFQRLQLRVDLGFDEIDNSPKLGVDNAMNVCPESQLRFTNTLRDMNIFSNFVALLRNSDEITYLRIDVNTCTMPNEYEGGPIFAVEEDADAYLDRLVMICQIHAAEILFGSDILAPFASLRNVKSFNIEWEGGTHEDYGAHPLATRHKDLYRDLKKTVENNWLVAHGRSPLSVKDYSGRFLMMGHFKSWDTSNPESWNPPPPPPRPPLKQLEPS